MRTHPIIILVLIVVTSLFLFPFNLPVSIVVNTKMVLAVIGAGLFVYDLIRKREPAVSRQFLILSLICAVISVWALFSATINGTADYAFAKYLVSVWVWLGGAYSVVWLIRQFHGKISIELAGNYLIAVCVFQCVLAYAMLLSTPLKTFINSLMGESDMFMGVAEGRIYGLGAALDPAGLRFSGVLVIISHMISRTDFSKHGWRGVLLLLSFALITVIGSMIARTTMVGTILGIAYIILQAFLGKGAVGTGAFWRVAIPVLLVGTGICVWLYNINPMFRANLRFGFEGFFSLAEKGRWDVRSTTILKNMVTWPESAKTWLIGDGYFDNPLDIPDIFGRVSGGFYKHTDIGYLRYVFYFGIVGLAGMVIAAIYMTVTCCKAFKEHLWMFVMLLTVTLIGWLKVSSDIIMVFAPFLIMAYLSQNGQLEKE